MNDNSEELLKKHCMDLIFIGAKISGIHDELQETLFNAINECRDQLVKFENKGETNE